MKTPHTPGPWKATRSSALESDSNHWLVIADSPHVVGKTQTVADINGPWKAGNYAANAHLIAAAPDLLAALQAATGLLLTVRDDMRDIVSPSVQANAAELCRLAESAIAKAQA